MKFQYSHTKLPFYLLLLLMSATIVSCGTMQTVADNDDGIYADDKPIQKPQRTIIVAKSKEYASKENYFTKEVERLGVLNDTDIFTDIEQYASEEAPFNADQDIRNDDTQNNYTNNEPWGYNKNNNTDVVIHINTAPQWGYYNNWDGYYGVNYNRPWWRSRHYAYRNFYNYGFYNRGYYGMNYYNTPYNSYYNNPYYYPYYRRNYYSNYNRYYSRHNGSNPYRSYRAASKYRRIATTSRRASKTYRRNTNTHRNNRSYRNIRSSKNTRNTRTTRDNSTRKYTPSRNTNKINRNTRSTRTTKNSRNNSTYSRRNSNNNTKSYNRPTTSRNSRSNSTYSRRNSNRSSNSRSSTNNRR